IAVRRRRPFTDPGEILSALLAAEDAGDRLTELELLHQCIFLLNAGHETTTNLIANAVLSLLEHPVELARLRAEPGLLESAVEEFLRFQSPNQLGNRRAVADAAIGSVAMPAGTLVTLGIGAANRDPARFHEPDRLDLGRTPNRHLAFITGIHACAGMPPGSTRSGASQGDPEAFDRDVFLLRERVFTIRSKYEVWAEDGTAILYVERPTYPLRTLVAYLVGLVAGFVVLARLGYFAE